MLHWVWRILKASNGTREEQLLSLYDGNKFHGVGMYRTKAISDVGGWEKEYKVISDYPATFPMAKDPKRYFEGLYDYLDAARKTLPKESHLTNIVDEVAELIDSTRYKLNNLS